MKVIEIRTHSIKDKNDEITPDGKALSNKVGLSIVKSDYQLFVSAPAKWCFVTLLDLGMPLERIEVEKRFGAIPTSALAGFHRKGNG